MSKLLNDIINLKDWCFGIRINYMPMGFPCLSIQFLCINIWFYWSYWNEK